MTLQQEFNQMIAVYSTDHTVTEQLWQEIVKHYSSRKRHYHTLAHLEHLLVQLQPAEKLIENREAMMFALFYHDIIYNPLKKDNEEKSAELAILRMKALHVPSEISEKTYQLILATKSHADQDDSDTRLFTDADLSVLGQPWDNYRNYMQQVRKEYAIYPDLIYNPGRKNVLNHFLHMDQIFKSAFFSEKFEEQARKNLNRELELLG